MLLTWHKSEKKSKIDVILIYIIYNHFFTDELDLDNPATSLSISFKEMFRHFQRVCSKDMSVMWKILLLFRNLHVYPVYLLALSMEWHLLHILWVK